MILTGMSGAGKSTALRCFEDLGFFCIDNLPPTLISVFLKLYEQTPHSHRGVAVVSDIRSGELFEYFAAAMNQLREDGQDFELVFIDCDTDELIRRFTTARRTPPLGGAMRIEDALDVERQRLSQISSLATTRIDSSRLAPEQLRQRILGLFGGSMEESPLVVTLLSFGFKFGLPPDADFVFDVRWLPNPFYVDQLRELSGNDKSVYDFVLKDEAAVEFGEKAAQIIHLAVSRYPEVHKHTSLVCIGCTGGQHRSVSIVNYLETVLQARGLQVRVQHRDLTNLSGS